MTRNGETETMHETYSQPYLLKTCSCDHMSRWKLSDILVQLQEIAGAQCTELGFGRIDLYKQYGVVWVITRTQVNMRRYPVFGETVTLTTYAGKPRRAIYPRNTLILDAHGDQIGECLSQWVLCSVEDRKMQIVKDVAEHFPAPDLAPAIPSFMIAPDVSENPTEETREAVYSDLDVNGHVNNTRYADWLCDSLGIPLLTKKQISSLVIDYRREIRPGNAITLRSNRSDDAFSMSGYIGDTLHFDIYGLLSERDEQA